jgi:hypothetical protein
MLTTKQQDEKIKIIKRKIYDIIGDEILEEQNKKGDLLLVAGAMQAVVVELYKSKIGNESAAMLYYTIADRLVDPRTD